MIEKSQENRVVKSALVALDDPARGVEIRDRIRSKPALERLYCEIYARYQAVLDRCPVEGLSVEIGSGAGFVKEIIPSILTTDILSYPTVERVVDACQMPFDDESLRGIFMLNTFHHIPDVGLFLSEAERCLRPGGRVLIVDQYPGWISSIVLRYLHHEPYDPTATDWKFDTTGPLSGANGALAWIVFYRDVERLRTAFPRLSVERREPHTPLRYWLSGGLKAWTLLPPWGWKLSCLLDGVLLRISPSFGSFLDIELVKLTSEFNDQSPRDMETLPLSEESS